MHVRKLGEHCLLLFFSIFLFILSCVLQCSYKIWTRHTCIQHGLLPEWTKIVLLQESCNILFVCRNKQMLNQCFKCCDECFFNRLYTACKFAVVFEKIFLKTVFIYLFNKDILNAVYIFITWFERKWESINCHCCSYQRWQGAQKRML